MVKIENCTKIVHISLKKDVNIKHILYTSVVQPIRHSPHVANGYLNGANGSFTKYFKIPMF
jgi:hypothetical protein